MQEVYGTSCNVVAGPNDIAPSPFQHPAGDRKLLECTRHMLTGLQGGSFVNFTLQVEHHRLAQSAHRRDQALTCKSGYDILVICLHW